MRVAAALMLLAAVACGGSESEGAREKNERSEPIAMPKGDPTGDVATTLIGADGGTVMSADGKLQLVIPKGALQEEIEIGVQPIESTAPHAVGGAYRLTPEGRIFDAPIVLSLAYGDATPGGVSVAFQDAEGFWQGYPEATLDEDAGTLSVETDHFSDWGLFELLYLEPVGAKVRTGASLELVVVECAKEYEEIVLRPLLPKCEPFDELPVILGWYVDGIEGGNDTVGTLKTNGARATYTAPANKPAAGSVGISAAVLSLSKTRNLLATEVIVTDGCVGEGAMNRACWQGVSWEGTVRGFGDGQQYVEAEVVFTFEDELFADLFPVFRATEGKFTLLPVTTPSGCVVDHAPDTFSVVVDGEGTLFDSDSLRLGYSLDDPDVLTFSGMGSRGVEFDEELHCPDYDTSSTDLLHQEIWFYATGEVSPDGMSIRGSYEPPGTEGVVFEVDLARRGG